jgi:alkanesulfonate monooxygenase SsuD/methylene tetrahydromethanopterin reductase-like flavin-dependent oxidoreductase (luciferase family)
MKLGILVPLQRHANAEFVRAYGETAESVGFDSLWIGEHVVITDDYASKFVVDLGDDKMHHKSAEDNVELDILAAVTNKIRLGSGIAVLPQRNPVYMAKEAGNVDWLSNGRFDFGVGMGWLREEFEVVNAPFERRGARTDSYLEVVKRLWCDESPIHLSFSPGTVKRVFAGWQMDVRAGSVSVTTRRGWRRRFRAWRPL